MTRHKVKNEKKERFTHITVWACTYLFLACLCCGTSRIYCWGIVQNIKNIMNQWVICFLYNENTLRHDQYCFICIWLVCVAVLSECTAEGSLKIKKTIYQWLFYVSCSTKMHRTIISRNLLTEVNCCCFFPPGSHPPHPRSEYHEGATKTSPAGPILMAAPQDRLGTPTLMYTRYWYDILL